MRAPYFSTAPGTELRINGQLVVVREVGAQGDVRVECPMRRTSLSFSTAELGRMFMAGEIETIQALPVGRQAPSLPSLQPQTPELRARAVRRIAYAREAQTEYPVGPKSPRLQRAIDSVAQRIGDAEPPSPHSVYRWTKRFVDSGCDAAVFVQDGRVIRKRTPRIDARAVPLLRQVIQDLLGRNRGATLSGITNEALALVAKELGYLSFRTKEGIEMPPEEYLMDLQSQRAPAGRETRRAA